MKTKAHALIERRYVERGQTTRFVVLPASGTGLPEALLAEGRPVSLDLLAGRPLNLEMDDAGLAADLCFEGPPVRCTFPWSTVVAVQEESGDGLEQTVAVTVAVRMDDDSLVPVGKPSPATSEEPDAEAPANAPSRGAHLRLVDD